MKLYIRNMVCNRCKKAVADLLESMQLRPLSLELGEVVLGQPELSAEQLNKLQSQLTELGFELIDDRRSRLIEKLKNTVISLVHHTDEQPAEKYSEIIARTLHHDYSYVSKLFSEVEGITVEQYIIKQKIEKVKELIMYDELSLSEIAWKLGYSSVAHLSAQFKKVTGLTPSFYKNMEHHGRTQLDKL